MPKRKPKNIYPITAEFEGEEYTGTYTVESDMVRLEFGLDVRFTQVGGGAENTAWLLLLEAVKDAKSARRSN